ncbi:hypothetical protein [Dyadobacter sp. NIV53]|uniref:TolB family protein n=1 Tax=Dyadobacter sp. NIV53 TaxID=2861765 RepID=UPI001C87E1F3|nr:hypothetical protein [Dyadobacter sp. NIV53]
MKPYTLNLFSFVLILTTLTNCNQDQYEATELGNFDISPDSKTIVFSYYKEGKSSIYRSDIDGYNVRLLVENDDSSFINPSFSPKGDRIMFVAHKMGDLSGLLSILDIQKRQRQSFLIGSGILTEAIFLSEDKVIFCSAKEYSKGSPVASKDVHSFDLYYLKLQKKIITKVTDLNSYGINRLAKLDSSKILMRINGNEAESGIYCLSLDKSNKLNKITPRNDPRMGSFLYYDPSYHSETHSIAFIAPYELYTMDVDSLMAKLIYRSNGSIIQNVKFANESSVFFLEADEKDIIFKFNIQGKILTKIPIVIPEKL